MEALHKANTLTELTDESAADELCNLTQAFVGFDEIIQFSVQHSLELQRGKRQTQRPYIQSIYSTNTSKNLKHLRTVTDIKDDSRSVGYKCKCFLKKPISTIGY